MSHVDPEQFPIMHTIGKEGLTVPHLGQPALLELGGAVLRLVPEADSADSPAKQLQEYNLINPECFFGDEAEGCLIDKMTAMEEELLPGVLYLHNGEWTTIGRDDSPVLVLSDKVAEAHARISIDEDGITITEEEFAGSIRLYVSEEDSRKSPAEIVEIPPLHDDYRNWFYEELSMLFSERVAVSGSGGSDVISLRTAETDIAVAMLNNGNREPVFEVDIFDMGADILEDETDPNLKINLNTIKPDEYTSVRKIIIDPKRPGILIKSVGRLIERPNSHAFKNNRSEQLSEGQALGLADLLDILEDRGV